MAASSYRLVNGADELVLSGTGGASPIVVISSEFTSPRAREASHDRLGLSGKRDHSRLHDSSEFAASLKIQGDDDMSRYEYLDELKGFMAVHKRPYLYIQRDGWISERRCLLRGDGVSSVVARASGQWLDTSLRAILPDGVIEDNEETLVTLRSGVRNLGVSYPLDYPMGYTPADSPNSYSLTMLGNDFSQPWIRVFGECTDPSFIITTPDDTTEYFSMSGMSVPLGSYLDIDFVNRRVFLDGVPANSYYSKVDFTVSRWWSLEPGTNRLLFISTAPSVGCYAEVRYRNNYLP